MFRSIALLCVILSMAAATARADSATTRPGITVAVVPFDVQGESSREWLGKAMQEGLATGLQSGSNISGIIVAGLPPQDAAGAIDMAKSTGADAVILGSIQISGDQIRVTGQIISTATGAPLGSLRTDGAKEDLFNIEDLLSNRVQRVLTPANPHAASSVPPAQLTLVGPTIASGPSRYFDGDVKSQITTAPRFADEYDRYYYQSSDTSSLSCGYGNSWCGGCGGCFGFSYCGGPCPVIATPVTGW
jgi:TolB-like protein